MDVTELVDACQEAAGSSTPTQDVSKLVAAFVHQPNLSSLLGDADRSTYEALYRGEDILVLHGVVPPTPAPVSPHDHRMWAVIGVYQGLEHNELFVRADSGGLESVDRFTVGVGDVRILDASTIHSVQARGDRYLGAIHVYGGDLFGAPQHVEQRRRVPPGRIGAPGLLRPASPQRDRARTHDDTRRGSELLAEV